MVSKYLRNSIVGILLTGIAAGAGGTINYGVRQKNEEYHTLNLAHQILEAKNASNNYVLATVLGMARKESRYWSGAVGRDHEAGLMQLTAPIARHYGLRVVDNAKRSSSLDKLLSVPPSEEAKMQDERLDPQKNLQAGISYFLSLRDIFKSKYRMNSAASTDFAVLSYNLGLGHVEHLLADGYSRNPDGFLKKLSSAEKSGITWHRRAIAISYVRNVREYRRTHMQKIGQMVARGKPSAGELLKSIAATPKEFYQRMFLDTQELRRSTRDAAK